MNHLEVQLYAVVMKVKMKVNYMGSKYEKWSGAVSGTGPVSLLKFGQLYLPCVALLVMFTWFPSQGKDKGKSLL